MIGEYLPALCAKAENPKLLTTVPIEAPLFE